MQEKYQPFCDMELEEDVCTSEQYDEIVARIKESANRDLKFSDTEIQISALDLHRYLNYRCHFIRQDAFRFGVQVTVNSFISMIIKALCVLLLLGGIGCLIYAYAF